MFVFVFFGVRRRRHKRLSSVLRARRGVQETGCLVGSEMCRRDRKWHTKRETDWRTGGQTKNWLTDRGLTDWQRDRVTDWLTDRGLTDWQTEDRQTDRQRTDRQTDRVTAYYTQAMQTTNYDADISLLDRYLYKQITLPTSRILHTTLHNTT